MPPKFAVEESSAWRIVNDAGAGLLVIATEDGLESVFVPVIVGEDRTTVWSHLARANPWWKSARDGMDVLAFFLAASAYVSPSHYPSRRENPGVVPTWNYEAAQVRGRLTLHDTDEWKLNQVRDLTSHFEQGRTPQWRVDDLDEKYRNAQLHAIVGIEISVVSIEGKAKLSQNRPDIDRRSVREHFLDGTLQEKNVAQRMKDSD